MPSTKIKIWAIIPNIIKKDRQIAPTSLEKILEINVEKYPPISKPLGYFHLYILHGEKNVLSNKGTEKKSKTNKI